MKTGRYSAEEQRRHDETLAKMATVIRLRPDLSYPEIAKMFNCGTTLVQKVVRLAGLKGSRPVGRRRKSVTTVTTTPVTGEGQ